MDLDIVATEGSDFSIVGLVSHADPFVQGIMLLLVLASVGCWALIFEKMIRLSVLRFQARQLRRQAEAGRLAFNGGGGLVRAIRVARMAAAAGMTCTPHMSGGGLGYLYVAHFASCVPNAGPFQEYKGRDRSLPVSSASSSLDSVGGVLTVPTGPGLGVEIDPAFTARATRIT